MEDKKDIFDEFGKRKKPSVPEGFFDSFSDKLMDKISEEESPLASITKSDKPEVPVGFFENFADKVSTEIQKQESVEDKPSRIISLKVMGFVTAVAACLLVMFAILPSDDEPVVATIDEVEELDEQMNLAETVTDDEYLAFLDGDDVIDFIIENEDIEIEDDASSEEDEDVFYYLEEDLEEYYLDEL